MATSTTLTVPARFNGPPDSAHGGYCAGSVAGLLDQPAIVELRAPPPLGTPMEVIETADGVEVRDGEVLVARARADAPPDLCPPGTVRPPAARDAVAGYVGFTDHAFPTCFACGPERPDDDGLRIFPGPVAGTGMVASPWTPDPSFAGADGAVGEAFVWAALDCPSGFAVFDGRVAVLASLRVQQRTAVPANEEHVVLGWSRGVDGRKLYGASAIQDGGGRVLAVADALWIQVRSP